MANTNAPFGFLPVASNQGGAPNYEMINATIAYSDTTKIYRGDPVKLTTTGGQVAQWTASTAVSQLLGVFWGCQYLSSAQGKVVYSQYWPGADVASTAQSSIIAYLVPVITAAPSTFLVQTDSTGATTNDIGLNCDVVLGTGSTLNGQSGAYLDVTTNKGTTATLPFRIVGLYGSGRTQGPANVGNGSQAGAYNWVYVAANVNQMTGLA